MNYDTLFLTPGGINGYLLLGSIHVLEKLNIFDSFKRYIGISVGSIISFLLILKYKSNEIFKILASENIEDIYFNSEFDNHNVILNLIKHFGMSNATGIDKLFCLFLKERQLNLNITFKELYEYNNIEFIVIASNITKSKLEYFSYKLTPNVSVLLAVKGSSAIPIIFNPIKYNNSLLVDGGFYNNFPNKYITNKTLTIRLKNKKNSNANDVLSYIKLLFNSLSEQIITDNKYHTIELLCDESGVNFNINNHYKNNLYNCGIIEAQKFLKWKFFLLKIFNTWKNLNK